MGFWDDGDAASWAQSAADGAMRLAEKNAKRLAAIEKKLGIEPPPEPKPRDMSLSGVLKEAYSRAWVSSVLTKDRLRKPRKARK